MQSLLPDWAQTFADALLNVPIYYIIVMLGTGHLLKLCAWFRSACIIPLVLKAESWFDAFVVTFTQEEVIILNSIIAMAFIAFLVLAYIHFFGNERHRDRLQAGTA